MTAEEYNNIINAINELSIVVNAAMTTTMIEEAKKLKSNEDSEYYDQFDDSTRFKSTRQVNFDGDIIITDPCYFILDKDNDIRINGHYERLGFTSFLERSTIYGDWSCTTYNSDNGKPIGHFCADSGMVCVFLLDEVLKYNPDFDYHITKEWTTTLIKDFHGTVSIEVIDTEDVDMDSWDRYCVKVVGKGNINFITEQTGF